jgi:hypothetical protein
MNKIEITVEALEEDISPDEMEENTHEGFARAVYEVCEKAEGRWGWCTAQVSVRIVKNGLVIGQGQSHLGSCSYLSAADFIDNSGYFGSMVSDAIKEAVADSKKEK